MPFSGGNASVEDTITTPGDQNCYTFVGTSGDMITVYADNKTVAGSRGIRITILKPDGSQLATDRRTCCNHDAEIRDLVLLEDGTYTIIIAGYTDATGPYTVGFSNLSHDTMPIIDGQQVVGAFDFPGDEEAFTFYGCTNDMMTGFIDNQTTNGARGVRISVLKPDGTQLATDRRTCCNHDAEIRNLVLPENGTYTLIVAGYGDTTGPYTVSMSYLDLEPACLPTEDPEPPLVLIYAVLDNDLSTEYGGESWERLVNNAEKGMHEGVRVRVLVDDLGDHNSYVYELHHDKRPFCPNQSNRTCDDAYVEGQNYWAWDEDTAHPYVLYNFIARALADYPDAPQIVLSLVGHGSGWGANAIPGQPTRWGDQPGKDGEHSDETGSLLWDYTPGNSITTTHALSTKALGVALNWLKQETGRTVDLLYLDACSMGMAEVAYEIRNSVDYLFASPNTAWASFPYDRLIQAVQPAQKGEAIGRAWVAVEANELGQNRYPFTLSLLELSHMNALITATTTLADALQTNLNEHREQIGQAFQAAERYESNYDGAINAADTYVDLQSFALQLRAHFSADSTLASAASAVAHILSQDLLLERQFQNGRPWLYPTNDWHWQEAGGLSIYLPLETDEPKRLLYTAQHLQWAQDSTWDEFLNAYWAAAQGTHASADILPRCDLTDSQRAHNCDLLPKPLALQWDIFLPIVTK